MSASHSCADLQRISTLCCHVPFLLRWPSWHTTMRPLSWPVLLWKAHTIPPYLMDMPATDFLFIFLWAPLSPPYYSVVLHVCRRTVVYLLIMNLTHSLSFSPFSWADLMGHHRLYGNRLIGIWCSYSHWRLGPSISIHSISSLWFIFTERFTFYWSWAKICYRVQVLPFILLNLSIGVELRSVIVFRYTRLFV